MLDLIREITQTLSNNRLRTILTGVSVSWGIFMLIVLLGASRGVRNSFEDEWTDSESNSIQFWQGMTSMPYKGYPKGRRITLKSSDIDALKHDNRGLVTDASARASVDSAKITTAKDVVSGGFEAVYPRARETGNYEMKYGRFINDADIRDARRTMVMSAKNARLLFDSDSVAVGRTVQCMGLAWTIVGVYEHRWRSTTMVPYSAYKAVTGNSDEAYEISVEVTGLRTEADGDAAEAALRATLGRAHQFNPSDRNALWSWNRFNSYLSGQAAMGYLNLAVWIIGIFTLLTGIVGVSNIMFVSVRERTHEIGIRRAIGAKPRSVLMQILAESVAMTSLFGYIGIVIGTLALQGLNAVLGDMQGFKNATVDISIAVEVTVALIIAGAIAGLFPALKAIKVKPVEALRDE